MSEKYVVVSKKGNLVTVLVIGTLTECQSYIEKRPHEKLIMEKFSDFCTVET